MSGGNGKIAIFHSSFHLGGIERTRAILCREFIERGFDVDMVLCRAEGPFLEQLPSGVRVVDLKAHRVRYSLLPLMRYLRRERPDALMSEKLATNVIAIAAKHLAGMDLGLVLTIHETPSLPDKKMPFFIRRLLLTFAGYFYPRARGIVAVSQCVADDMTGVSRVPRESIEVIYNPVPVGELSLKAGEPFGHRFFSPGEPPVILAAGRLVPQKDFPTLLRAFARIARRIPARLVILGEGEERPALKRLARELGIGEWVDMPGFVPNPYVYMARANLFVLSSVQEGFPNVLLEALALGCPVVSTDCPCGPAELLEGGRYGTLVPVGDAQSLADAILECLDKPPDAKALRARAAEFSPGQAADRYLELLFPHPPRDGRAAQPGH